MMDTLYRLQWYCNKTLNDDTYYCHHFVISSAYVEANTFSGAKLNRNCFTFLLK